MSFSGGRGEEPIADAAIWTNLIHSQRLAELPVLNFKFNDFFFLF